MLDGHEAPLPFDWGVHPVRKRMLLTCSELCRIIGELEE